jgi:glucose/arabinose dehydrogenase
MKKIAFYLLFLSIVSIANATGNDGVKKSTEDNAGLKLPPGFSAVKVSENIGRSRHIAVTPQGDVYVKSARLYNGKGILLMKDLNGDGKADTITGFGKYTGTGILIKNGYLYASSDEEVFRYKLNDKSEVINPDQPERIITGLINRHQHESKSIALDNAGNIYVNIGAYANACQEKDRTLHSPGRKPCPILDSAGGIWQFKADKLNQTYADGIRYATGLRNVVGLDWNNQTNTLFVMQHGRDQLHDNWPELFDTKQSAELPAETMYELHKGSNCGWPYIYYDPIQHKKILAPEYGGDGKKEDGADAQDPVIAFPAHMGPNALLFYTGNQFPEKYKNGAFIAFHGSWNRAPEPQKGYFVAFVPFKNGKPSGEWEIFADDFAGGEEFISPNKAKHRPTGLAQGPDGSLYVSDDVKGAVYKISYKK